MRSYTTGWDSTSAGHQGLQRERDRSGADQLLDGVRAFGIPGLQMVPAGGDLRIQAHLPDSRVRDVDDRKLIDTAIASDHRAIDCVGATYIIWDTELGRTGVAASTTTWEHRAVCVRAAVDR